MVGAAWFADPTGRHEHRYWDGSGWTDQVADAGVVGREPVAQSPEVGDAEQVTTPSLADGAPAAAAPLPTAGADNSEADPPRKPWFRRTWVLVTAAAVVVLVVISAVAGGKTDSKENSKRESAAATAATGAPKTAPPSTTAPTTAPPPGFSGDGTFVVGQKTPAGVYVSVDNASGSLCYWQRAHDASGNLDSIIENDNARGQAVVQIQNGEVFTTRGCNRWVVFSPPGAPLSSFGDGVWIVPSQVNAGRWQSSGGSSCYWARLKDLAGGVESIAANDNVTGPTIVDIAGNDAAFKTSGCGTWTRVG